MPFHYSAMLKQFSKDDVSGGRDSNPRPPPWQGGALPTELPPHVIYLNIDVKTSLFYWL